MLKDMQRLIRKAVFSTGGRTLLEEDLHDIVQDVNAKLLANPDAFDASRSTKSTFVYTVAMNATLDAMRTMKRRPRPEQLGELEYADPSEDALTLMLRHEQQHTVRLAISTLTEDEQTFLAASMDDAFNIQLYAKQHRLSTDAVYVRKWRLMQKLKAAVRNQQPA